MGWCGATDIMDAAIQGADALLEGAYEALGVDPDRVTLEDIRPQLDDLMRPFVRKIARALHEGDWDCVDEAEAFDRFPQEMYDHDDREHEAWIRQHLADATKYEEPEQILRWSQMLKAHTDKMKAGND